MWLLNILGLWINGILKCSLGLRFFCIILLNFSKILCLFFFIVNKVLEIKSVIKVRINNNVIFLLFIIGFFIGFYGIGVSVLSFVLYL